MSIARLMQMARAGVPSGPVWLADLANASYDGVSFSVAVQETIPTGLAFKPDGTKMYVLGTAGDDVGEYSLSTAWDISTASFTQTFSVAAQDTNPAGMFLRFDGTKMYILGSGNDSIYQYSLSTAYDISTASYDSVSFSLAAQDTSPSGIFLRPDGLKLYVVGSAGDAIYEYSLSVAWDISTASLFQTFSVTAQDTSPTGVFFSPDGLKTYVIGLLNDAVYEYSLSAAWNISTASFTQTFSVAAQENQPQDVFFKSDGSKMYIVGSAADTIYQYSTA